MTRDRHADQLHARLAGGAGLTADERRHVATCAACQRAVADVGRLDEQLRVAAAGLASEPIPDADLEPLGAPRSRWARPLSVVAAAGLIGIVIGYGLGQVRPPTGADTTPSPSGVAERSTRPSESGAVEASPSAAPTPEPAVSARPTPLATGGAPCADGEAGFSIVVPDGWYASLRQGDLMACAFLAPEPFDPLAAGTDPDFDAPIRLATSVEPMPTGTVVEHTGDGDADALADRWIVERDGEAWLVYVVALRSTVGDAPSFLHLGSRESDGFAADALDSVIGRLAISDPLPTDPDAVAAVEELFADADVCSDLERGVNVILPDDWWTNTPFGDLQPCTYFAPGRFEIGDEGAVPDGVPMTLEVTTGAIGTIEEILGFETLVVDRHAARRWELTPGLGDPPPDTRTYQYVVELDDTPDDGRKLVLTVRSDASDDYERDKAVLDEMTRRLVISPTPAQVLEPGPDPSCGWELVELTPEGQTFDADARSCLWEAYEAGDEAEMISTSMSVEGTVVREIYRVLDTGEIEFIVDWSHDLGARPWQLMRCTGLEQRADDELTGAILFDPTGCDDPEEIEP